MSAAPARTRIGIGGPVAGPDATLRARSRMGVEQAVEDSNASGGILGQQLIISVGDDAADPNQGVSVANKFVGDAVSFMRNNWGAAARASPKRLAIRSLTSPHDQITTSRRGSR